MRWSCFVTELSATGRSHMVVALLYAMQSPCNCFTLSLSGSDSRRSNSWRDDNDAMMEIKVSHRWRWWSWWCFGDGDHKHKMMMAISYHLYWLHVMFIFYASYLALIDGSILRWSLTNYQEVFSLSMHRCESSSCWDTTWWSGVIGSTFKYNGCKTVAHGEYSGYTWRAKHIQIWPRNTESERSSMNHIVDMINKVMFTNETTPSHVMIGHGLVDLDHVIT